MRLRTRQPHSPSLRPPGPAPLKVVPVDAHFLLQCRSMADHYLTGSPLDYGAFMATAVPSLLARIDELARGAEVVVEEAQDVAPPPAAEASRADELLALLREANDTWDAADCDIATGTRPPGCACLGCRIHRATTEG